MGYVSKITTYHHGSVNMEDTIIGMAQNFVGRNNLSLLEPKGQFGSRIEVKYIVQSSFVLNAQNLQFQGAAKRAAARYLHLKLGRLTNLIFRNEDKNLLTYLCEDGIKVEPEW